MKESPEAKAEGSGYWRDNLIISSQGRRGMGVGEILEPRKMDKKTKQDAEARSGSRKTRGQKRTQKEQTVLGSNPSSTTYLYLPTG